MQIKCVRMGGTKCKIKIEKIIKGPVASVAFSKRRKGLFSKASELCLLSPNTQIAILATPLSSNSHASFYSFGHSSVDHVVSSLLHDQSPLPTNQFEYGSGLGLWWEDARFDSSENVDELKEAVDAVSNMLNNARLRLDKVVKSNQRDGALIIHQEQEEEVHHHQFRNTETTNQITKFEGAYGSGSGSGSLYDIVKGDGRSVKSKQRYGALVIHKEEDVLQLCNTDKNNIEETTNQIPEFGGAGFGGLSKIEEGCLHIDHFLSDFNIAPL